MKPTETTTTRVIPAVANARHISLRAKVLVVVLAAVVCVQGSLAAVRYLIVNSERYADLNAQIEVSKVELTRILAEPLYNYHQPELRTIIDAKLAGDSALQAAVVQDIVSGEGYVGRVRAGDQILDSLVLPQTGMYRIENLPLAWQGRDLGEAHLAYSDAPLRRELDDFLLEHLLVLAVEMVVLVAALVFAIQRIVIKRVRTAVTQADAIRSGDLATRIPPTSGDEFDHLATALNDMRASLRRQLEDLGSANTRLEQAMELRTRFLANMSHEIRTPMNGVIGSAQLLALTDLDSEQTELVQTMERSGEAVLAVINDILDLSKIEAGEMLLESTACDLRGLLDEVMGLMAETAERKGLGLVSVVDASLDRPVLCDQTRLRQVLLNLTHNAVKFTERGSVRVSLEVVERRGHRLALAISVRDTGIGIPPDIQSSLFQPFMQADGSTTRRFGGTGLGLTISKQLLGLMGGQITVASSEGAGSTFTISLELSLGGEPFATPRCAGRRVCLFSDSDDMVASVMAHLKAGGVRVRAAPHVDIGSARTGEISLIDCSAPDCGPLRCVARCDGPVVVLMNRRQRRSMGDELSAHNVAVVGLPARAHALWEAVAAHGGELRRRETPEPGEVARLSGLVLLVEDHVDNREVISRQLAVLGLDVIAASNGQEAIDVLGEREVDLVLMDCQMPVLNGFAATARLRDRKYPGPIVALTANALVEDRERCLAGGMDDHIAKPVTRDALVSVLARYLPRE
ncbi:MAG: ATP-binding protein [Planctomycetota bacterium]|jgi:two-component system sensor histidine kinase/response regulator|nr:ATP-binding protein [Planctomycetota bacterium]